jgi:hypothetical protein
MNKFNVEKRMHNPTYADPGQTIVFRKLNNYRTYAELQTFKNIF